MIINLTHLGAFLSILANRTSGSRLPLCHRRISVGFQMPGWEVRRSVPKILIWTYRLPIRPSATCVTLRADKKKITAVSMYSQIDQNGWVYLNWKFTFHRMEHPTGSHVKWFRVFFHHLSSSLISSPADWNPYGRRFWALKLACCCDYIPRKSIKRPHSATYWVSTPCVTLVCYWSHLLLFPDSFSCYLPFLL